MINQFKTLNPINLLLLFAYTFFMRISILINPPVRLNFEFLEPYTKFLIQIPIGDSFSVTGNILIAGLLIYIQAIIFNRIVNNHTLLAKPSFLPALLFITGASLFDPFLILSPVLICNFMLILIMDKLLKIGKSPNAIMLMFDIGLYIAVGTLIYFPFVMMLLLTWLSLLLYRSFNWREWISGLVGFLTIIFFLAVFYYWNDNLGMFYKIWLPLKNKFPSMFKIRYNDYLVLVPVGLTMVLATIQLRENFFRSFISTRKAFQMLFFMFLIGVLSVYTKSNFKLYHFLLCVPPGAVLLAYYFSNATKRWFYESLFLILVLTIQFFLFV
ncbi:hypothetical protein HDF26_005135 [Pedobacter cryoconitis]|uniref:Beta-carotene 15,15'-monooxygenase n=1 Tax=Pedobacter cryoconitis TaxID=188932 RepID=A0A7W8ZMB9_9SPHI|nr:DUF6427 family protein [Pedobacter cryoconitis]MBB5636659.1 hypothetical protein [Pedobacter cryoconitis]MBB6274653.1 hypothetical protein [Pedobacter cryoconitis]